jgi:hypothetical protein
MRRFQKIHFFCLNTYGKLLWQHNLITIDDKQNPLIKSNLFLPSPFLPLSLYFSSLPLPPFFSVQRIKPRASHMPDYCSATELHPQLQTQFLLFLAVLGFELKAWCLLGRCCITSIMLPLVLVIFPIRSEIYAQTGLNSNHPDLCIPSS